MSRLISSYVESVYLFVVIIISDQNKRFIDFLEHWMNNILLRYYFFTLEHKWKLAMVLMKGSVMVNNYLVIVFSLTFSFSKNRVLNFNLYEGNLSS